MLPPAVGGGWTAGGLGVRGVVPGGAPSSRGREAAWTGGTAWSWRGRSCMRLGQGRKAPPLAWPQALGVKVLRKNWGRSACRWLQTVSARSPGAAGGQGRGAGQMNTCKGSGWAASGPCPWPPVGHRGLQAAGVAPRPRRQEAGLTEAVPVAESAAYLQEPTQVEDHW